MTPKVFIAQAVIQAWESGDTAEVQGDRLRFRSDGCRLRLRPASLFMRVAGGGSDPHQLVGKVKEESTVTALGGETYMSSVLVGDTAYDVQQGFVAVPEDGGAGTSLRATLLAAVPRG